MRILLVEDDPALGQAVRDYLTQETYAVDWAERLGVARACLPGEYACVVLDLGLPDGDGLSLLPDL
ncbi:MAG TPA: response regulator, partial [Casimicrobiaceae bacterium]|nr:response regulator [Casimicrobiaceae bacterium]